VAEGTDEASERGTPPHCGRDRRHDQRPRSVGMGCAVPTARSVNATAAATTDASSARIASAHGV
jgi:hypothetical protein